MQRTHWTDLPPTVRDAIQQRTGPVLRARTATEGMNSEIAALLDTTRGGVFVKGLRMGTTAAKAQHREATVAPYLQPVAPRLLWQLRAGGWHLLAFERLTGRHADYTPGSPDLPAVIDAVIRLQTLDCPPEVPLRRAEDRWAEHIPDIAHRTALAGDTILHTDYNLANVLIDDGGTAHLIDWAWPTRGAGMIDPCCLAVRLIAAGHTAAQARTVVSRVPSFACADPAALLVFADATARMWREIATADPTEWKLHMSRSADQWAQQVRFAA